MASQGVEFVSPVGRLVQGSCSLEAVQDYENDNKPKLDDQGNPVKQCFLALAIAKDNPELPAFYALLQQTAKAAYPTLFDANGNCTNPKFAWKLQDGDGTDSNGKSVKDKEGFAGHWIFKFATQYMPKCYHYGKYDPIQAIQNPTEVIKRGYFIRIAGRVRDNGVAANDGKKVPGLFLSPDIIELMGFGPEIIGGPDASKVLGGKAPAYMPQGMSAAPVVGSAAAPSLPGAPAPTLAPPSLPALPGAPAPVLPPPPLAMPAPPPAGPVYTMTAKAQGATREALLANGWTDATLVEHGVMTIG